MRRTKVAYYVVSLVAVLVNVGCRSDATLPSGTALNGEVLAVSGGDVLRLRDEKHGAVWIHLFGVDAPVKMQPFQTESHKALEDIVGTTVTATIYGEGPHPWPAAWVWLTEPFEKGKKETSLNYLQVRRGLAWHYDAFASSETELRQAEEQARSDKQGIWQDRHHTPVEPWERKKEINDDRILPLIGKHLDALESTFNWALAIAVVTSWSAFRQREQVKILGVEIESGNVSFVVSWFYVVVTIYAFFLFWRLGDLMWWLHNDGYSRAVWSIGAHTWAFNPFAIGLHFVSGFGLGLLVMIWWFCALSVALAHKSAHPETKKLSTLLRVTFAVSGTLVLAAIVRVHWILSDRIDWMPGKVSAYFPERTNWAIAFGVVGFVVGFAGYIASLRLQARRLDSGTSEADSETQASN